MRASKRGASEAEHALQRHRAATAMTGIAKGAIGRDRTDPRIASSQWRMDMLRYVHMGFESVFEEELHVVVEGGVVKETRTVDNRGRRFDNDLPAPHGRPIDQKH